MDEASKINNRSVYEIAKANQGLVEHLEVLEKKLERYRWISVEERLPVEQEDVLITCWDFTVTIGRWLGNRWGTMLRHSEYVIAWMPLPEPYKSVKEEDFVCKYCNGLDEFVSDFNGYRGKFHFCPVCGRKIIDSEN